MPSYLSESTLKMRHQNIYVNRNEEVRSYEDACQRRNQSQLLPDTAPCSLVPRFPWIGASRRNAAWNMPILGQTNSCQISLWITDGKPSNGYCDATFRLYCTHCGSSWYPHVTYDTCAVLAGCADLNPRRSKTWGKSPFLSDPLPAQFFFLPPALS